MLSTVYNTIQSSSIMSNISKIGATLPATVRQIRWLEHAMETYAIKVDLKEITMAVASTKITAISNAINRKLLAVRTIPSNVLYAVLLIENVISVKSYLGTKEEVEAKICTKHPKDTIQLLTKDIDEAKLFARGIVSTKSVLTSSTNDKDTIIEMLPTLTVEELMSLVKLYNINIGKCKLSTSIIAKIIAQI